MLEYAKIILPKVSFSRELFAKELNKCIAWVEQEEMNDFNNWCQENFKEIYPEILTAAFSDHAA